MGSEAYQIVYQLVSYHAIFAAAFEEEHKNYYLTDKARLIAPITSVSVTNFKGESYKIIENGAILPSYGVSVTLTSGSGWIQ